MANNIKLSNAAANAEADAICERLRARGVVCQPASQRGNVLKFKPPLVIADDDVDFALAQLRAVLETGW